MSMQTFCYILALSGLQVELPRWFVKHENDYLSSAPKFFPPASELLWLNPSPAADHVATLELAIKTKAENTQNLKLGFFSICGNLA